MAVLTRDDILSADDLGREHVEVPEWGGEVIIRTMTGDERDTWERTYFDLTTGERQRNIERYRAPLVALTAVNERGERLFAVEDVIELGAKSSIALNRLWTVALRINGMGPGDVEELAGN